MNKFVLDCTSKEWCEGHHQGLNDRNAKCPYPRDTQQHFNWVDGWLTGDSERSDIEGS